MSFTHCAVPEITTKGLFLRMIQNTGKKLQTIEVKTGLGFELGIHTHLFVFAYNKFLIRTLKLRSFRNHLKE